MGSDENSGATLRQLIEMINTKVSETVEAVEGVRSILTGKDGSNGLQSRVARNEQKVESLEKANESAKKWKWDAFVLILGTAIGTTIAALVIFHFTGKT